MPDPSQLKVSPQLGIRPAIENLSDNGILDIVRHARETPPAQPLIPLWFGEGDILTPDFVCDAARTAMGEGYVFYSDQRGIPELREALSRYIARAYGVDVGTDRLFAMPSGMACIMATLQMLVDPGDEIVFVSPVWPNGAASVRILGGRAVEVPLAMENGAWRLDLDRLFDACGRRTRAIFVNSPSNPTGWVMPLADIRAVMDFARERGIWVLSDEVYSRLVYGGASRAPSFLDVGTPEDRLVVLNSFSKNWAMTGWRLGWIVAPAALSLVYQKMLQFNTSGAATFVQKAGAVALDDGDPFIEEVRAYCAAGREIVCDALFSVEGAPDCNALAKQIIDEAGVGLAPGSAFGAGGAGYIRLCFASSAPRLEEAMERLRPVLG
jgi:aspartate aminotransferase